MTAVSEWSFALDPEAAHNHDPVDPNGGPPPGWPIDGNWELRRFFSLNLEKWKKEWLSGKPYISMLLLLYTIQTSLVILTALQNSTFSSQTPISIDEAQGLDC